MIDDLEGLYFNDKVYMRSNSINILKKIPKLNFNVVDEKQIKVSNDQNNGNNVIINMNQLIQNEEEKKQIKVK